MIPVLIKELRTRMRGWRAPAVLIGYLAVLALVCFLTLQSGLSVSSFSANQATQLGIQLFNVLAILQGVLILFVTPATTAASVSGERQRQTLDLLLVTRLSALGITVGKLLAAVSFSLLLVVCTLPIFSVVFLFGGVGLDRIAELFLLFVLAVVGFGSLGLLVSVYTRRPNSSTVVSYVLVLLLVGGLALLSVYLMATGATITSGSTPLPVTAFLDPGIGVLALLLAPDGSTEFGFPFSVWQSSVACLCVLTVACVCLAALSLRRQDV
jgi:ABC-type transport system involved in multi-copper enzyme maturation permease subunit